MGKMTSDFVALAVIFGGAGLGYGLTSLFAERTPVAQQEETSVEIQVVRQADEQSVSARVLPYAVIVTGEQGYPSRFRARIGRPGADQERMEWRRAEMEELRRRSGQVTIDIQELYESALEEYKVALEGLEGLEGLEALESLEGLESLKGLEDLDLGQYLTFEILQRDEDEDQRRRRRRRRPRQ